MPLPQIVVDELSAHIAAFTPMVDAEGAAADPGRLVFTSSTGGPVQQQPWASVFETARKRIDLPEWATPHDLRHFDASVLIASGASVKAVQTRLGHASAKTTLDTYGHLFPDEEDRTRAAVDAALGCGAERAPRRITSVRRRSEGERVVAIGG